MRISDWSSDVCSSDLPGRRAGLPPCATVARHQEPDTRAGRRQATDAAVDHRRSTEPAAGILPRLPGLPQLRVRRARPDHRVAGRSPQPRSEEHTSELQSLMRISYAVFCLKKKKAQHTYIITTHMNNTTEDQLYINNRN